MIRLFSVIFSLLAAAAGPAAGVSKFEIMRGRPVSLSCPVESRPVLSTAIELLSRDMATVFGDSVIIRPGNANIDVTVDSVAVNNAQGFRLEVRNDGTLLIVGHDSHGAAYGVMELSRLMGVSPWEWWADAVPEKKDRFELPAGYVNEQSPSVEYRGIFINDEDWGLMPWSSLTMEPENRRGVIGPKTTERIFELMLRLRANYYWPPMHECSEPFFLTPGNREMAGKYGIYIGGSHCEPMASSTAVEWHRRGKGEYDYVNNSGNVRSFWEDRLKEVAEQEIVYTLGMRGVHDGAMNGAKTVEEQKRVLGRAIADQRDLLKKYVGDDLGNIPQVFIPYKEVLDVYNAGLEVPDDVTLMWCDDNYGYIRHFPTDRERNRVGGNGVYYHVSYWGRPHDYLWLGTFSPGLLYQQMRLAYDKGIRKMWILNVGDIKPAEYQIELFMDMAWNMDKVEKQGVNGHLENFLCREFGETIGKRLLPVMNEHYRLAFIRKPEFMGNTREEERNNPTARTVKDLPWSDSFMRQRLSDYRAISDAVENINGQVSDNRKDAYFQLVKYPVQAAAQMNHKMLYAQLARHGKAEWAESDIAHDSIASLTAIYNSNPRWTGIMDCAPRKLPPFKPVPHVSDSVTAWNTRGLEPLAVINGTDGKGNFNIYEGIGYTGRVAGLMPGEPITYRLPKTKCDSISVECCFVPTHPVNGVSQVVKVSVDDREVAVLDFTTKGRSEQWKENVLNNRAVRSLRIPRPRGDKITVSSASEGILLDQIILIPIK